MSSNSKIKKRFDGETEIWKKYHNKNIKTIIDKEIFERKQITKKYLLENYKNTNIRILEIGCGTGNNLIEILELCNKWKGKGVDISTKMIDFCKDKFDNFERVNFEELNIEEDDIKEKFDIVILLGVVGYLNSNKRTFQKINEVLNKNGEIIFTYGNKKSIFRKIRNLYSNWSKFKITRYIGNFIKVNLLSKPRTKKNNCSYFKNYTEEEILNKIPDNFNIKKKYNIVYSSGIMQKISVIFSDIFKKILPKKIKKGQAFTKLIIAQKSEK